MKLETFFEKFDLFAGAPDAVAKMRELVLQLAVQGRLVSQSPKDEPAGEMVTRVAAEKLRLLQATEIKSETPLDPISDEEVFPIPDSWIWLRAGDLCRPISSGSTPDQSVFHASEGIPYLKVYNIRNQCVDFDYKRQFIAASYHEERMKRSILRPGDVIMNIVGPPLGKVAIVPDTFPEWNCNQAISFFRPIFPESAPYLYTFLKEGTFLQNIQLIGTAGQDNISVTKCKFIPVPLPPLAEQKRIVAKVDELMALCDRLEAQQQEREEQASKLARASLARFADAPTPANLPFLFHPSYAIPPADLRKSILTLAVQGKLVPQDPNDESAETLVERVSALREQFSPGKRAKAAKRIRELDDAKCSHDVPDSWTWCRLGDLVLDFRYGTSRKCARNVSGVPVLRIPNIQSGRIDSTDLKFTDMPPAEFKELRLQDGDLLLVRSNGSENLVGRSAVASVNDERFAYAGYLVRARLPKHEVFAPFLHVALSTPSVRDQIEGPIRTTSGVKNINTTELSNLVLPLPPLAEQRRIVAKVEQLMVLVVSLETQLAASRATAANLLSALVAELTTA